MKFVDNNNISTITKFISFFINKNYHFRMIFDSNLNDYEIFKKRLLTKKKRINNKKKIVSSNTLKLMLRISNKK